MRRAIFILFSTLWLASSSGAGAITFNFSFNDDPSANISGRTHILGGSVTGMIFGLVDNTANQTALSIQFTSDLSGLGMADSFFNSFTNVLGNGITVSGGQITAANLLLNFLDSAVAGTQLRFNYGSSSDNNHLIWNGGGGPENGIGNADGFAGTTFTAIVPQVPLPAGLPLFGTGLVLLGFFSWRRRRKIATTA